MKIFFIFSLFICLNAQGYCNHGTSAITEFINFRCSLRLMRKEIPAQQVYIESLLPKESSPKITARDFSEKLGLAGISISPSEAHLIQFLLRLSCPTKVVEIGTLTGLSASYFLEALPSNGKLWTFEKSSQHAEMATQVLASPIQNGQCEIRLGDALLELPKIESDGPFDAIFIDGNKAAYYQYWKWAEKNLAAKGLIVIDNVFLAGAVWGDLSQQKFNEKQISEVRKMNEEILRHPAFSSCFIPTSEGLLVAYKK